MRASLRRSLFAAAGLAAVVAPHEHPLAASFGPQTPPAFPANPFSASVFTTDNKYHAVGLGSGQVLGVASLTMTNFSSVALQFDILQVATDGQHCSAAVTGQGTAPYNYLLLPTRQTVHLDFPTPLIVHHYAGVSCLGLHVASDLQGGSVDVLVNGFTE